MTDTRRSAVSPKLPFVTRSTRTPGGTGKRSARRTPRSRPPVAAAAVPLRRVQPTDLVSVVIATIGRSSLRDTVTSLLGQSHQTIEVIVVDNAPATGNVTTVLSGISDPRLRVLTEPVKGVSAARNTGVAASTGSVVAFTDDDAVPEPRWVTSLFNSFLTDDSGTLAAVTGRVVGINVTTEQQRWFDDAQIFDKGFDRKVFSTQDLSTPTALGPAAEVSLFFPWTCGEVGNGNNMAFHRDVFKFIGNFDHLLGPGTMTRGGEDLDLLRRALLAGYAVAYSPDALVGHEHRAKLSDLRAQMYGYGVGMSSVLAKGAHSGGLVPIIKLMPRGLEFLISPSSGRNTKRPNEMPRSLVWLELAGYLAGPALYTVAKLRLASARLSRSGPAT